VYVGLTDLAVSVGNTRRTFLTPLENIDERDVQGGDLSFMWVAIRCWSPEENYEAPVGITDNWVDI